MLLVLRGESRSTQPWSHLKLCAAGTNTTVLGSRRCELSAWMWDFRSSSHLIPRFGDRPDRSPTRSPRHRITRLPIGASATDAVHQDDVDGQYPQSLMTSRWCPASNMSHWPRLGRGQAPCSCSRHSTLKNVAIPRGEAWEYNGRDACLPTARAPGPRARRNFVPVFDRFMPFRGLLCRFCDRNCEATVTKRRSRDVR